MPLYIETRLSINAKPCHLLQGLCSIIFGRGSVLVLILGGLIILGVWSDILISEYSNVPQSYKGKQNLGRWVSKQRELYWDMKKEPSQRKHSSRRLNEDRVARLEAIGFLWRGANAHHKYMRDDDQLSPIPLPPSPANAITVEEVII